MRPCGVGVPILKKCMASPPWHLALVATPPNRPLAFLGSEALYLSNPASRALGQHCNRQH